MQLTEEQLTIIRHGGGHARVSAVAGSGKTTTMIARIGELLRRGIPCDKIMVLMFNRSARDAFAQTMEQTFQDRPNGAKRNGAKIPPALPEIRTFHSLGYRLTQSFTKRGALLPMQLEPREFIAERLAKQAATTIWQQQESGESKYLPKEYSEEFLTFIDLVKASIEPAESVYRSQKLERRFSFFAPAFALFEEMRLRQRIRFYSDLIADPLQAMLEDKNLADWVGNRVDYIIVDEYQDINESQQELLKIVAGSRAQVMVVGDVDQCIYEWRGAKPAYINRHFGEDFPGCTDYTLSYTFRYGHSLALAANHLIINNVQRDDKLSLAHPANRATRLRLYEEETRDSGQKNRLSAPNSPLASIIKEWCEKGRGLHEAAVLVRLYAQSVTVELALLSAAIPYRLEGGEDIFSCEEILALMGYLYLAAGRFAELSNEESSAMLTAMLSQPHLGIKQTEIRDLAGRILPLLHISDTEAAIEVLENGIPRKLAPFIRKHFTEAAENWRWLCEAGEADEAKRGQEEERGEKSAGRLLRRLIKRLKLYDFYHSFSVRAETAENRIKICEALLSFAEKSGCGVNEFIDRMRSFANLRHDEEQRAAIKGSRESEIPANSLLITSIHRAKGLEWPLVILPGLTEGSIPFYRAQDGIPADSELEDERRLFYVAITRAAEELVLLYPPDKKLKEAIEARRRKRKGGESYASRFLFEANLGLSISLGELLDGIAPEKTDCEIRGEDIGVARRYLRHTKEAESISLRQVKRKGEKENEKETRGEEGWRQVQLHELAAGLHIRHPQFGEGIITALRDRKSGRITVDFSQKRGVMLLASKVCLKIRR